MKKDMRYYYLGIKEPKDKSNIMKSEVKAEILLFTKDDIDLAYCAGIFNTGGIDVLGKELERLKHIDRKPHNIFQRYKPELIKETTEIGGEKQTCENCKHQGINMYYPPCGQCPDGERWEPIKTE